MDRIRRILLAVRGGALPADALARAAHLGDEVNVLHVVDEDGRSESDFVSAVATHARVVGAELIVLAPEDAASGSAVTGSSTRRVFPSCSRAPRVRRTSWPRRI